MPSVEFLGFYINAFTELSTCRSSGMGIGNIPFTAIAEYARIYSVDNFDDFLYFMRVMDNEFLRMTDDKRQSSNDDRNQDGGQQERKETSKRA